MAIAPGTRLGSYDIIALLGAGGMGEVYRARDHKPVVLNFFEELKQKAH